MRLKKNPRLFFWIATIILLLLGAAQIFSIFAHESPGDLVINEFLAANRTGLTDEDGDYSDWIEIHNRANQALNLAGWSLTDDPNQPEKWTFPNITLGSNEYLVVFASGKDRKPTTPGSRLHANFKLNRAGEFLALYNIFEPQFFALNSPQFPKQFRDMAYGLYGDELAYGYLAQPTPGEANAETPVWEGLVAPVEFSLERGFYNSPFNLKLSTSTPGATIRYTTDGSQPTEINGRLYTKPVHIDATTSLRAAAFKPNFWPSYVNTHTYIFLDHVLTQPANPPNFPATWGIHAEDFKEYTTGSPVMADYEMDPEIVNHPRYSQAIKDGLTSIPIISMVMDSQSFDELYSHPRDRGPTWERPASIEFIDPNNHHRNFQINAGIRIHGGVGRQEFIPKHSFRLFFRDKYGAAELEYPLFPDSPVEEFDTIVLRAGADRSFAGTGRIRQKATYTRDEWLRASQIAMSDLGSHGHFAHLYLNGLYWGLYNIVERPDDSFMSSYFGGRKQDWFVANQDGPLRRDLDDTAEALNQLFITIGFAGRADDGFEGNEEYTTEKYAAIKPYIDIPQFSDYIILNWYAGTKDWPENNWYAGIQSPAGKFRLFVWDGQEIWNDEGAKIGLGKTTSSRLNIVKPVFEILIQNPDFRMQFTDRIYKHLFNNGALTDANSQARWKKINDVIDRAIIGESARWGDVRSDRPITRDDWLKARDDVLAQMEGNGARLIALLREAGYYPDLDPPDFNRDGGLVTNGFNLTMTAPSGLIYYTTNGSDPRAQVTGQVAAGAVAYSSPLVLTATTRVKARVLAGDTSILGETSGQVWSALHEATFRVVEQDSKLRITEIMYNPIGGGATRGGATRGGATRGGGDYEFIELKNAGDSELDLSNASFSGLDFTFLPGAVTLAPGEFMVLARNPTAFAQRYPGVTIGGTYQGQLSNKGETISLQDAEGKVIASVTYDDENGWPLSPDGWGDSLVFINLDGDPNAPQNWRASPKLNGSPGADNPAP